MRMLLIRIDPDATTASWQMMERGQPAGPLGRGSLQEASAFAPHSQVVVLVPSETVFITQVALPGTNRNKLLKAVPFAVEDQLVEDVDKLHFALAQQPLEGYYTVAAIEHKTIETWHNKLRAAGIRVDVMLPDVMVLPALGWSVVIETDRALVRTPLGMFATDNDNLPLLLNNVYEQAADNRPHEVAVYDCGRSAHLAALQTQSAGISFNVLPCGDGIFGILARHYQPREVLNLLQGNYSAERDLKKHLRPWLTAAALFAVWLTWQLAFNLYGYIQMYRQSNTLAEQLAQQYKQAFPNDKKPDGISERIDMERRMKALRKQSGAGAGVLPEILTLAGPVLNQIQGLSLRSVHYVDGKMDIELSLKSTSQLDALKDKLTQQTGWNVDVQSASTRGDSTDVRLLLQQRKS
ncbi:MAG: hypothetical protein HY080_13125 [Gammaproteobacteria bacterium]|nr:hypothetical protein [Gammaproteobacteria bacterium]